MFLLVFSLYAKYFISAGFFFFLIYFMEIQALTARVIPDLDDGELHLNFFEIQSISFYLFAMFIHHRSVKASQPIHNFKSWHIT